MATETTQQELVCRLAEDAAERFLRYVRIDTQSAEGSETYPSTAKQLDLLRLLAGDVPTIGVLAHVDTSPSVSGANVKPQRIRYEGGKLALPADASQVLDPDEVPELAAHAGHELITTDGTTLLGADDKAGVAEIMAAAAYLVAHPEIPHGPLRIAFNPDEEIGTGTKHFDIERFGAVAAYTLDGSTAGELQEETFSGAAVKMRIKGRSIHPGWAKDAMVNAVKLAGEILARLPKDTLSPETTEGREGYVHPNWISGEDAEVELRFIVRDFENDLLDQHVQLLRDIAAEVAGLDPRASIEVESSISYRNMRDALKQRPEIVGALEEAIRRAGLEPRKTAIRGGTDGSALTEKGLPTPNIFTGGQQAHSEREWICVEDMGVAAATVVELAKVWAEQVTG